MTNQFDLEVCKITKRELIDPNHNQFWADPNLESPAKLSQKIQRIAGANGKIERFLPGNRFNIGRPDLHKPAWIPG